MEVKFKEANSKYSKPFFKYLNCIIQKAETEKYPEMVEVVKCPKNFKLQGKKYLNVDFAVKAVDFVKAEQIVDKGKYIAKEEMKDLGFEDDEMISDEE